jgi:phytoene desaturase (3,4-didehydrolycopene-forming)
MTPRVLAQGHAHSKPSVVVVGAGAGGLAVAGRLARADYKVTLVEKNQTLGGRMRSEYVDEWRFDTGPSLLLFLDKYVETFDALGVSLADCVDVKRVEPTVYRVFYPGSSMESLDLLSDPGLMAKQLEGVEVGAGDAYLKFLKMAKNNLELGVPYFIDRDYYKMEDAKGLMDLLPYASNIDPWALLGPHDFVMRRFFQSPYLRAAFTFQDLYVGLSPYTAPAVFSLLAGTELIDGVYYPVGGFQKVVDALETAVRRCGVEIRTGEEIDAIEIDDTFSAKVVGVRLTSGERIPADIVVCNRDLPAAYSLIDCTHCKFEATEAYARNESERLGRMQYSTGVIAFNWCMKEKVPALAHHNVFLSDQPSIAWQPACTPDDFAKFPNFYVHVPSRTDGSAAPEGCESVMVLLPVANMQTNAAEGKVDYKALAKAGKDRIFEAFREIGEAGIEKKIGKELIIDPVDWEQRYGLKYGAAFGLSHGLRQLSLFRPSNKDNKISGLYFVGASTRPGNGVPLCFIGAKHTAERIMNDWDPTSLSS